MALLKLIWGGVLGFPVTYETEGFSLTTEGSYIFNDRNWNTVELKNNWVPGIGTTSKASFPGLVKELPKITLEFKDGPLKESKIVNDVRLRLFDQVRPTFGAADAFFLEDVKLSWPEGTLINLSTGNIRNIGSIDIELDNPSAKIEYITNLKGYNYNTNPSVRSLSGDITPVIKRFWHEYKNPYNWLTTNENYAYLSLGPSAGQKFIKATELSSGFEARLLKWEQSKPERSGFFTNFKEIEKTPSLVQGMVTFEADKGSAKVFDNIILSSGKIIVQTSIDGNPTSTTLAQPLDNRSYFYFRNPALEITLGEKRKTLLSFNQAPDVVLRTGKWDLQSSEPLVDIKEITGYLELFPFHEKLPDDDPRVVLSKKYGQGEWTTQTRYPKATLQGFRLEQDGSINVTSIQVVVPQGVIGSVGLSGVIPVELTGVGFEFSKRPDDSIDLNKTIILNTSGRVNTSLFEQQLRAFTKSPDLQLAVSRWIAGAGIKPLTSSEKLDLRIGIDPSTAIPKILNAPALRLIVTNLVIPLPDRTQATFNGSLIIGATNALGEYQAIPQALLADAGVTKLLPSNFAATQALLAGEISSADGNTRVATVLTGGVNDTASGTTLQLDGQVRLEGSLLSERLRVGGAIEAALSWQLDFLRNPSGETTLKGFPTIKGLGLDNASFELAGVMRVSVDKLAWTVQPQRDQLTGSDGLIGRARGFRLDILKGELAGKSFSSAATEVLLFDLNGSDGIPDHFYIDGLELAATDLKLGPVAAEGLRLKLAGLTNLPEQPGDNASVRGSITLEADRAQLQIGQIFKGSILPNETENALASAPVATTPALSGSVDLTTGDLSLAIQNFDAALSLGGKEVITLAGKAANGTNALRLDLKASATADTAVLTIQSLVGAMPLFALNTLEGQVSPSLAVSGFAVQRDGDVELREITLALPPGYSRQWNLGGIVPFELNRLGLRFDPRPDRSADLSRPVISLAGRVDVEQLQQQLRTLLNAPALSISLSFFGSDGQLRALDSNTDINLDAQIDTTNGDLKLLNSPGWQLRLNNLPLPISAQNAPLIGGDLLLPGTDANGEILPLPAGVIRNLLNDAGINPATTTALVGQSARVVGLLKGAVKLQNGQTANLFDLNAGGSLLLGGSFTVDSDGTTRLGLSGEGRLAASLNLPGLSGGADLSTGFVWDLVGSPETSGEVSLTSAFAVTGALARNLNLRVDGLVDLKLDSLAWYGLAQEDVVIGITTPGLIASGKGLSLEFLATPLKGLKLGDANTALKLYDLQGSDGVADHFYLNGDVFALQNVDLGWLKSERIGLALLGISNLPVLDPNPSDTNTLSGAVDLAIELGQVGSALRFERAGGLYDLSSQSLELNLEGLNWNGYGVNVRGDGELSINPSQPNDRWLHVKAAGSVQTGLASLPSLGGTLNINLDSNLNLRSIEGSVSAAAGGSWLGNLQLKGDLSYSYAAASNQATLKGNVNLAGVNAEATIRFTPGEQNFEAALRVSNQNTLQLADWLQLTPQELGLLYTYNPTSGGLLNVDGSASLNLLGRQVDVGADLQVGFGSRDGKAKLLGGGLELKKELNALDVAGFKVDLIKDRSGNLPGIRIESTADAVVPRLNGAVRLKDLQDLEIQLDPQSGSITYTPSEGWSFDRFEVDLTPSGARNLGFLQIGDNAHLKYADQVFTIDPDLSVNGVVLGKVLSPVARVINNTIAPITDPVVDLLLNEINLDQLNNLDQLKPKLVPGLVWDGVTNAGRDIYTKLLETFEGTPGNPYRDGKVQVVEVLDSTSYLFFTLLKANPTLGKTLAQQLGLPSTYVNAVLSGAPFIPLASGIETLEAISNLATSVKLAEANAPETEAGDFKKIPNLSIRFRPQGLSETIGSISKVASDDSAVLKALLEVQKAWKESTPGTGTSSASSSSLFNASTNLSVPVIDDWAASILKLITGKPLDVIRFDASLDANLSFEANKSIPVGIFPLVIGAQGGLSGELNAGVGLTTSAAQLLRFGASLLDEGVVNAVAGLLAPAERDGLGLYLAGQPNQPLLRLEPSIRVQGGLDFGLTGVRAFAGLQGSFDVELAAERLYLGNLVDKLKSSTALTPQDLGRLFSFDANVNALFGIDGKIGNWDNILTATVPVYKLSVPRVSAGPVINGEVLFDTRTYDSNGNFIANVNLQADVGELQGHTDSQGAYRLNEDVDPWAVGNRDGVVDFKDGLVIAGNLNGRSTGQRISLIDSISGVDLGVPLVGLPGEPITLLTTLKYSGLLRWNPNSTIGGQPLTPELITNVYAGIVKNAPASFRDDNREIYQDIASGDEKAAEEGLNSLIFSYQHLAAVLTIVELFRTFKLDYTNEAAWGFMPDADGIDTPEIVAFSAYGRAIRQLFGTGNSTSANPLDQLGRQPIASQFDVSNEAHLRAVFKEILAFYPTQKLFNNAAQQGSRNSLLADFITNGRSLEQQQRIEQLIETSLGDQLSNIAEGLARVTTTVQGRLAITKDLEALIPIPGSQLMAASIAGPKRLFISTLIPALIETAESPTRDEFRKKFYKLFFTPTTVDAAERQQTFLIKASTSASEMRSVETLDRNVPPQKAIVTIRLTDHNDQAIEAPDYGLTIRFRLGGTAIEGVHYTLPEEFFSGIAYVPPGASETRVEVNLLPAFFALNNPLMQLELLSADSGFGVDPNAAVISLMLADSPIANLNGARQHFQAQGLVRGVEGMRSQLVAAPEQANAVLRGVNGQADTFVLRPEVNALPHLENFRPQEGDRLLIDPQAVNQMRSTPALRPRSAAVKEDAFSQLETQLGTEAISKLNAEELLLQLEPLMEALDPRPTVALDQFNTYGGLLFDLVSRKPLALLSDQDESGNDLAWSALSTDPLVGAFAFLPSLRRASTGSGTLTLGDPTDVSNKTEVVLHASLTRRPRSSNQVIVVVLEADELEQADTLLTNMDAFKARAKTLFSSLEASDVTLPNELTFERSFTLKNGQSIRVFEVQNVTLDELNSPTDARLQALRPGADSADPNNRAMEFVSDSGLTMTLELQDQQPNVGMLIAQQQVSAPVMDFTALAAGSNVKASLTLTREADYDAITGFYRTLDAQGSVRSLDGLTILKPGDTGYAEAALAANNRVGDLDNLQVGDDQVRRQNLTLSETTILAPFALVNGNTFFAYAAANTDGISHFRSLGNNSIGLEDTWGGGDRDYDDLVLSFSFTNG